MSLFPDIKIDGHGRYDGLDPNGGSLQKVIQRNLFVEADRGQAFRRKLASVLERIKTPVVMPRLEPGGRFSDILPAERGGEGCGPAICD